MPPPNMPFWHKGYFEGKAIGSQQKQEEFLPSPHCLKAEYKFPLEEGIPLSPPLGRKEGRLSKDRQEELA